MWKDPIVEEVRAAGRELLQEAGGDLHSLCEYLRKKEQEHKDRLVSRGPRRLVRNKKSNRPT